MQVYKVTNKTNGKFYVGKDANDREYYMGSGTVIKLAIQKYGLENFEKTVLEYCETLEELREREKYWIEKLNARVLGYNIASGGEGGDTLSSHPDKEEIYKRISESNKGKKRSSDAIKNMKSAAKTYQAYLQTEEGNTKKQEMICKMVETKRRRYSTSGRTKSEIESDGKRGEKVRECWTKEKRAAHSAVISRARSGMIFSDHHKKSIGESSKGRIPKNRKALEIDGELFSCAIEAATKLKIPLTTIRNRIQNPRYPTYIWVEQVKR